MRPNQRPARLFLAAALGLGLSLGIAGTALAANVDIQENPAAKVFDGKWMQSKNPQQEGVLMYLTTPRARAGNYFSIRCDKGAPSVRLGFGKRPARREVTFDIDGRKQSFPLSSTGVTNETQIFKGKIYTYKVDFTSPQQRDAFLHSLGGGHQLRVSDQREPVDLAGAAQAIREQAGYCR